MERQGLRALVYSSLLVAMGVALKPFSVPLAIGGVEGVRLGFVSLPIIISSFVVGPWMGLVVGTMTDLLGFFIFPRGGAILPQITLVYALTGALPVLFHGLFGVLKGRAGKLIPLVASIALSQALLHVLLMSVVLWQAYGMPLQWSLTVRSVTQAILIPVYVATVYTVLYGVRLVNAPASAAK